MFGFGMFNEMAGTFNVSYRCYSVSMFPGPERQDVDNGGKIILPPSALEHLTRLNVVYPMLFKMTNPSTSRVTHCGVLEFVADEGRCYIPYWMMRNLMCDEGATIRIESATLPVASYSKFEPQSVEFLDITNPKAMLENALRNFACLTSGDVIAIKYNDKIYELRVLETKPGNAVSIIECDMDVEFAKPIDYVEPAEMKPKKKEEAEPMNAENLPFNFKFLPFTGSGNRLDGKEASLNSAFSNLCYSQMRGIPDVGWSVGHLTFIRDSKLPVKKMNGAAEADKFKPFEGEGQILRPTKK